MPFNEFQKIRSMERFLNLDISRENELQNIVTLAAEACQTPAAYLVFTVEDQLILHYKYGFLADTVAVEDTFWNQDLNNTGVTVIQDTLHHPALAQHALVNNSAPVRFFAGVPLVTHDGYHMGSLYVFGQEAKALSERRKRMLELLAHQAVTMVEFELGVSILKEQYAEAKNAENKLRSFFESSKSSHLLISPAMEVLTFNKTFHDLTYKVLGRKVTAGKPATDFIFPLYIKDFVQNFNLALKGETVQYERLIAFGDLGERWNKLTYNPSYGAGGEIIGVSFNATDISKRKQSEEKIIQQNEALRRIAYLQSHELRKPVATILGLTQLLKMDLPNADSTILKMLESTVQELDSTIHSIVRNTETQVNPDSLSENFIA
jgi:PAS domain S-box-containing protein